MNPAFCIHLEELRALFRSRRRSSHWAWARLDAGLDLQSTRHCLIVIHTTNFARTVASGSSLDVGLDPQSTRHCLIVIRAFYSASFRSGTDYDIAIATCSGLDAGLDFQGASHRMVVVTTTITSCTVPIFTSFHVRFDFQT